MTEIVNRGNSFSTRKVSLLILISAAIILSWSGVGDRYADTMINEAIIDAGLLYGSARAVNALVSVIQSIDFSLFTLMTISPGEALDPVNDLVERFSSVMTVAIASLALQKILLYILEHNIFNIMLTLSGVAAIASMIKPFKLTPHIIKIFITLAVLRVSLSFIILANSSVDAIFLKPHEEADYNKLMALQSSLKDVAGSIEGSDQLDEISRLESERNRITDELEIIRNDRAALQASIDQLEKEKADLQSRKKIIDRLNPFEEDDDLSNLNLALSQHKEQIDTLKTSESIIERNIDQLDEQIECANIRSEGGTCSITEWIGNKVNSVDIRGQVERITDSAESTIQSVLNLIMMAILKSILLPLLFWWILYKSLKVLWNDSSYIVKNNLT